jgi:hypothetical protein
MNRRGFLTGAVVAPLAVGEVPARTVTQTISVDVCGAASLGGLELAEILRRAVEQTRAAVRDDISRGRI